MKFLAAGLPAFVLAVPANYALVEFLCLPKSLSYALVLCGQISLNYFMCRYLVFRETARFQRLNEFFLFFGGILAIRFFDWFFYVFLVHQIGLYYLAAQFLNVGLFSAIKFLYSRWVLTTGETHPEG